MKLLGSVRFISQMKEAFEAAKSRKENKTYRNEIEAIERNIETVQRSQIKYLLFETNNLYRTIIGGQRFAYHDGIRVELITTGT